MFWFAVIVACTEPDPGEFTYRPVGPVGGGGTAPLESAFDNFAMGWNYPWMNYGHDFGSAEGWGTSGVSADVSSVETDLLAIADVGGTVVRWFIFADGRASPEFDASGRVTGFDDGFLDDLSAALDAAQGAGVYVIPVLFDFIICDAAVEEGGVVMGGHRDLIANRDVRQSFLDHALVPMLEAFGAHPAVAAWEVINEPEWAMATSGFVLVDEPVEDAEMQAFVSEVAGVISDYSSSPVTVGSADWLWLQRYWAGSESLGLLQFHYYSAAPFDLDVATLGLKDVPVLLGEVSTANPPQDPKQLFDAVLAGGFAGVLPWSYRADDGESDFASVKDAFASWAEEQEAL